MPTFDWIYDHLIAQETPLALGFAGVMMAGGLILLFHTALSKAGITGTGKVSKQNEVLRQQMMDALAAKAEVAAEVAGLRERVRGLEEQLKNLREDHEREMQDEKDRTKVFIDRINQIAELDNRLTRKS